MGNGIVHVMLIILILLLNYQTNANPVSNEVLQGEIKELRTAVNDLTEKTTRQETQIKELTEYVYDQEENAAYGQTGNTARVKRATRRRRRRAPEIGFLVRLVRPQLKVKRGDIVTFDHIITNIGNAFDGEAGKFVCKIPGTYMFDLNLVADTGSYLEASIKLNDMKAVTAVSDHRSRSTGWDQGSAVAILILKKGDIVGISIDWPLQSQVVHGEGKTTFSGYLLRRRFI